MESGAVANESACGPLNYSAAQDVHFYGKRAAEKRRRSDAILLVFRALTFAFSLAAVLVMGTKKHGIRNTQSKVAWHDFDPYRYVLAVNGIICLWRRGWRCTLSPGARFSYPKRFKCGSIMSMTKVLPTSCSPPLLRALPWPSFSTRATPSSLENTNAPTPAFIVLKQRWRWQSASELFSSSLFPLSSLGYVLLGGIYYRDKATSQNCGCRLAASQSRVLLHSELVLVFRLLYLSGIIFKLTRVPTFQT